MKKLLDDKIDRCLCFFSVFAEFCGGLQKLSAGLWKHALYLSRGTFRERLNFLKTFFYFDIGEKLLEEFFVKRFRHVCKNCLLGIEEKVSKKNFFPKWFFMIFALPFSDFDENCFWLLAEKLRHSGKNCTQAYVAGFRRKQSFWNYSIL